MNKIHKSIVKFKEQQMRKRMSTIDGVCKTGELLLKDNPTIV